MHASGERNRKYGSTATLAVITAISLLYAADAAASDFRYLGQARPGKVPELFGPGTVSTDDAVEFAPAFAPDGREIYFTRLSLADRTCRIMVMVYVDGEWTGPEEAPFSGKYMTAEPCFDSSGSILYFSSKRPCRGSSESIPGNIWMVRRDGSGWSRPVELPQCVNTAAREGHPCVSSAGNLYFHRGGKDADIFVAIRDGDGFAEPVRLG
ncbi:MAG TPA: hypothetical protein VLA34_02620, partial [Candidatus Krumholzibacterium sp.]|nr:hypothetical protein [Candidatus Krumholzibacterium sp.]